MLLGRDDFVASMNSVVLMVNNVVTRLTTISFEDFFPTQRLKSYFA